MSTTVEAVCTKGRQIMVAAELEAPPSVFNIETFLDLSLCDAAAAIRAAQPRKKTYIRIASA